MTHYLKLAKILSIISVIALNSCGSTPPSTPTSRLINAVRPQQTKPVSTVPVESDIILVNESVLEATSQVHNAVEQDVRTARLMAEYDAELIELIKRLPATGSEEEDSVALSAIRERIAIAAAEHTKTLSQAKENLVVAETHLIAVQEKVSELTISISKQQDELARYRLLYTSVSESYADLEEESSYWKTAAEKLGKWKKIGTFVIWTVVIFFLVKFISMIYLRSNPVGWLATAARHLK